MSARKKTSGPDMGGLKDDWTRVTKLRQEEQGPPPPEPTSAAPAPTRPRPGKAESAPVMSRRSWYAEQDAVESLATVVDDIHFATRAPKHQIVSELFRAAVAAAPKVEKKLSK